MGLPIWQERCRRGKDFREKVIGQEKGSHASTNSHALMRKGESVRYWQNVDTTTQKENNYRYVAYNI